MGLEKHDLCEYPVEASDLASRLTKESLVPDSEGAISVPDAPGLGLSPCPETVKRYLVDTEIVVGGCVVYRTPEW